MRDPREGALHHPPPRQHPETLRRHQPLPIHHLSLLGPPLGPGLSHLLRDRLLGLAYHLDAQAHRLLGPPFAPPLVAGIDPQMREAREPDSCRPSSSPMPSASGTLALCTLALSTKPSVSTSKWRFLPSTFLAGSKPRSFPPTPEVLAD